MDIMYYKKFNNLNNLSDNELIEHYNMIGIKENIKYFTFDYNVDNMKKINTIKDRINCLLSTSNININKIIEMRKQYIKKFYIYNKASFFELYKDFDIDSYRNKYFNANMSDFDIMLHYHTKGKYMKYEINNKLKVVIYTSPLVINSGGITVLHNIAKVINEYDTTKYYAKIFCPTFLKYNNVFCTDFADIYDITDNTIVIYPEIVRTNPLNAKNVLRWVLLDIELPHRTHVTLNWDKNDMIYWWEPKPNKKQLCCPYFNDIFKKTNNMIRTDTCYLIKKGKEFHKNMKFYHNNSIEINQGTPLSEINNIFNKCKYFYCYDPNTMFIIYAAVCGCIPIVYPIEGVTKEQYFKERIFNHNNVIYNMNIMYGIDDTIDINNNINIEEYYRELFKKHNNSLYNVLKEIKNNIY